MTTEPLVLTPQDARGVVTLTLNRPQAFNALSEAMLEALQAALDARGRRRRRRAWWCIAAAGKAFCAGHDLKEMRAEPSPGLLRAPVRAVRPHDDDASSACRCR
ncbi:MAG: enoyl-CoA hydratase/isomerase family protein [Marinagarivorans sp.]|nr:enoyl-CoA hydratase/isomerase family protein [Marinagarivorans sp.]